MVRIYRTIPLSRIVTTRKEEDMDSLHQHGLTFSEKEIENAKTCLAL